MFAFTNHPGVTAMRIKSYLIVIAFLLSIAGLYGQPKIKAVPGTNIDFGDVYEGTKVERVVTIKNVGTDTLLISEVKAQCGCTATLMTEKKLAPSDSGKLSITFDTHNYGGQKAIKHVYVSSNDTSNAKYTIEFTANVLNVLDVAPKFLSFDSSKLESTYVKTVTISNPGKESLKILSVETKFDQMKVNLMKNQLMPGEQTQLQAVFHPTKSGTFQGSIDLTTNNPIKPKYEIKFFCWVNRK